jgi:hypothetical protein
VARGECEKKKVMRAIEVVKIKNISLYKRHKWKTYWIGDKQIENGWPGGLER